MGALAQPDPRYAPAPGYRYHIELINGREVEKPMPKKLHAFIQSYLIFALTKLLSEAFRVLSELDVLTRALTADGRLVKIVAQNVWIIWPEKRRAWEVGADRIDERSDKLTLSLPAGTALDCVDIQLAEMWKVPDQE